MSALSMVRQDGQVADMGQCWDRGRREAAFRWAVGAGGKWSRAELIAPSSRVGAQELAHGTVYYTVSNCEYILTGIDKHTPPGSGLHAHSGPDSPLSSSAPIC